MLQRYQNNDNASFEGFQRFFYKSAWTELDSNYIGSCEIWYNTNDPSEMVKNQSQVQKELVREINEKTTTDFTPENKKHRFK